jgi:hypothetical protein
MHLARWRKYLGAQIQARRESTQARKQLELLNECLKRHEQSYWEIGDCLMALVGVRDKNGNKKGGLGYTLTELAARCGYKPARLCQIYRTAVAFPRPSRCAASLRS